MTTYANAQANPDEPLPTMPRRHPLDTPTMCGVMAYQSAVLGSINGHESDTDYARQVGASEGIPSHVLVKLGDTQSEAFRKLAEYLRGLR